VNIRLALLALAVALGLNGAAAADPLRLAQAGVALPPYEIMTIVRSAGFDPVGSPALRGGIYHLRAVDLGGEDVRLLVDARTGRIQSVAPMSSALPRDLPPRRVVVAPYPYGLPPYGLPPRARMLPPDLDDLDDMPPPPGLAPRDWGRAPSQSPQVREPAARPEPAARSAAVTPVRPPLPRPRPATKAAVQAPPPAPPQRSAPVAPPETKPAAEPQRKPAAPPENKPAANPVGPPVVGFD
jgi:hypothetical protein